jgi:hypothetical protein
MINTSNNIITKLASYEAIYASYEPKNKRTLTYRAHSLIGLLIKAQFMNIFELSDLVSLNDDMDNFVRELKAEFELIYVNLDNSSYPDLVEKFQAVKYSGQLGIYHTLVIDILKVILIRILTSNNQDKIEKDLFSLFKARINQLNPPLKQNIIFKDRSDKAIGKAEIASDVEEYIKRQIDISLDS